MGWFSKNEEEGKRLSEGQDETRFYIKWDEGGHWFNHAFTTREAAEKKMKALGHPGVVHELRVSPL